MVDNDGIRVVATSGEIMEDIDGVIGVGRENPVRMVVSSSDGSPSYIESIEDTEIGGVQIDGVLIDIGDIIGENSDGSTVAERGEDDLPPQ